MTRKVVKISVSLNKKVVEKIDKMRGMIPRSRFMETMLERELERCEDE